MSDTTLVHPLTRRKFTPVGYRKDGRPIWPIMGGSEPPNQPPAPAPPAGPERLDGVSEAEWAALGDPGKTALVRERQARTVAEQALAVARATPPAPKPVPAPPKQLDPPKAADGQTDVAELIKQAVAAATAPLLEAQAQRDADTAATAIRDAVAAAAAGRFHDVTDALTIDLAAVTDGTGRPDQQKITAALEALLVRKPHLGQVVFPGRQPAPGTFIGAGGVPTIPLDDRVKATLARMQQAAGVKLADT